MHATRARLPQKRTAKKSTAKKSPAKKAAPKLAAAQALPLGVASLAAHRAQQPQRAALGVEIYGLVEWIAPARESWRRGELEIRRTACMPMTATLQGNGVLALTDLPGQGDALQLASAELEALRSGATPALTLTLPGMRITVTAEDLLPALPAPRPPAQILAFPGR
ncbi:hypothetical protein [Dongia sp. agr-C8]